MKKIFKNKMFWVFNIFITILAFIYVFIDNESYALEDKFNYMGDYILNPEWVEYMNLSDYEKNKCDIIPEKFIVYSFENEKAAFNLFRMARSNVYPEYYNLNDLGYSTKPRNQYSLGLCWAFAGFASVESNMLMNGMSDISRPITFAERQIDYVGVHPNYIAEGYNPYYVAGRTSPGAGGYPKTVFSLMETGMSPVETDVFGVYNEDKNVKSMSEIFNLDNVEYVVDGYVNLGSLGDYSSSSDRTKWVNDVKEHVMNYGAVAITTIGPLKTYAGSCLYEKNGNYMLNVRGNCNPETLNNRHAMAIIGWDDNYTYEYCRLTNETKNDLTGCSNIVSGKGAFILKNSWGDVYPYPYFAYNSNVDGAYGVTKISEKNWDVIYDYTKSRDASINQFESIISYDRSTKVLEKLVKISFYTNTKYSVNYDIYFKNSNDSDYTLLDSVTIDTIGLNSIDIEDLVLSSDSFSIKIESDAGYVDLINAFTKYSSSNSEQIIDTNIKTGYEYRSTFENFSLYTVAKDIQSGERIDYKFIDSEGNDISNLVTISNNFVLGNMVNPTFVINSTFPVGNVTLQTIYNDEVYDTDVLKIVSLENLWSAGDGSINNPFLIENASDFLKIFTDEDYMESNYKLINDIDFSSYSNWNAGEISNYLSFKGTLDGDGHIISGLNCNSNLCSVFYQFEDAKVNNLIFTDFNYNVAKDGWASILGILAYNSEFENIVITRSNKINGQGAHMSGLIGRIYDSTLINIANYADINSDYSYNTGNVAGIVSEAYGSIINECYNHGNITSDASIAGGIVSYLGNSSQFIGTVSNSYNYGNIETNNYGGGIVGKGEATLVETCYNVFSTKYANVGNIVGTAIGMVIQNSYYLIGYGGSVYSNETSTFVNVMSRTETQLKSKTSYTNFDFENIWTIGSKYPYFKDFNYVYINDLVSNNDITLNLGENKKIDIKYSPSKASVKKIKYTLSNDGIIEIDDDFNVYAVGGGNVVLTLYALDGGNFKEEINITVVADKFDLSDYEIIDDEYIKVNLMFDKANFINSISVNELYKIKIDGDNEYLATGNIVKIFNNSGILEDEYKIIVLGDVTGTGKTNVSDVAKLYQYIKGVIQMDNEFILASDVVKDGNLKVNDVAKLYQYIKKKIDSLEG